MQKPLIAAVALGLIAAAALAASPGLRDTLFSSDAQVATFQASDHSVCNTPGGGFGANVNYWRPRGPLTGDLFMDIAIALFAYGSFMVLFVGGWSNAASMRYAYSGIGGVLMVLALGLAVSAFTGIQAGPPGSAIAAAQTPVPTPPAVQAVKSGLALYTDNCEVCHGPAGKGDGPGGVNLPIKPKDLTTACLLSSDADVTGSIQVGYEGLMPAFKDKLSPSEIAQLVQYLRKLSADAAAKGQP